MSRKVKQKTLHDLAIALCEGQNVWFKNHTIRFISMNVDSIGCEVCDIDCLCDMDMQDLCTTCDIIKGKSGYLKLVVKN